MGHRRLVLVAGALVTGYPVFVARMVEPDGPWDAEPPPERIPTGRQAMAVVPVTGRQPRTSSAYV
ncbi:hypothetical protein [Streptomyces sp. NPDC002690]